MIRTATTVAALIGLCAVGSAHAQGAAPKTLRDCPDCQEMVVVPAGSAMEGSTPQERLRTGIPKMFGDHEAAPHKVTVKAFALGKTEVTRGMYAAFVADTKRPDPPGCAIRHPDDKWGVEPANNWRNPGYDQTDQEPAACIGFDDAAAFTAWYSAKTGKAYRLPTEAEWEYAARAGTTTAWDWGDNPEAGCKRAGLLTTGTLFAWGNPVGMAGYLACTDRRAFTRPVGSFAANAFGVQDMQGSIFEWVGDCATVLPDKTVVYGSKDTPQTCDRRFMKGGAFHTPLWLTRSAARSNPLPPATHMSTIGFRLARDLD